MRSFRSIQKMLSKGLSSAQQYGNHNCEIRDPGTIAIGLGGMVASLGIGGYLAIKYMVLPFLQFIFTPAVASVGAGLLLVASAATLWESCSRDAQWSPPSVRM